MAENTTETAGTILLVEDDPGDRELTRRALDQRGITTRLHSVQDGEEALEFLLREGRYRDPDCSPRPDLVLLDLNLPKITGIEVLDRVREHPNLRTIPVVALTTSKHDEDITTAYDLGVNSYIVKPVEMDQFVETLRALRSYWFGIVQLPPGEK
jgi:CheY-like chemotaxis protein